MRGVTGRPIRILVACADCDQMAIVTWPEDEYHSTLAAHVTLDGEIRLPEGWWAQSGSAGGDNILRCPEHARHR